MKGGHYIGILRNNQSKDKNILTEHGFEYTHSSVTGALQNCYETAIKWYTTSERAW